MRCFTFILSLLISSLSVAQDLIEFENGRVADANDLNQNLQLLMDEILELKGRAAALEIENCVVMSELGDGILVGNQENEFGIAERLTIAGWVRRTGDCGENQRCDIVSLEQTNWGSPETWSSGVALYILTNNSDSEGTVELRYRQVGEPQTKIIGSSSDLTLDSWVHIAAVKDTDSVRLFVNGRSLSEITTESYVDGAWEDVSSNFPQGPIEFDGDALDHSYSWIGRGFPNGLSRPIQNVFVGNIARVGIWTKALTMNEIRKVYSNTFNIPDSEPAGFWPMNQTSGEIVADLSGASNNGLLEGNASWSENCRNTGISSY